MLQFASATTRRLLLLCPARRPGPRSLSALVVAEHGTDSIEATLPAVAAAAKLRGPIHLLVAGSAESPAVLASARRAVGVSAVFYARHPAFEHGVPEPLAALLVHLLTGPWTAARATHVLAASSVHSRAFLPRAAALLGVQMLESVTSIDGPATFQRPIYAGNALATVELAGPGPRILTVRSTAFPPADTGSDDSRADIVPVPDEVIEDALRVLPSDRTSRWVADDRPAEAAASRPDLSTARVVVAGGRGMQSKAGLDLVAQLADRLGGAVGASRAIVDAGLAPNELQVGQSGKVVAPELYVAVGISGAIQHVAGMRDSGTIVAINKDPEAPIFKVADIGLVADGPAAVEELLRKLPQSPAASSSSPHEPEHEGLTTGDLSFTRASDLVDSAPVAAAPAPQPAGLQQQEPDGGPTGDLSFTRASDLVR